MTHVSLFAGIGGLDLSAELAGFETILQVEMDDYANRVLQKHWPDVPRIKDIRNVNRESINEPVTVISGGFPCQPFSAAGKHGGREDDRYLWPEMFRVIQELSPAWIVGENVSGLLSIDGGMEIEHIISQLEDAGYEVCPLHYPAAGVGALHRRDRVFIVAHTESGRVRGGAGSVFEAQQRSEKIGQNERQAEQQRHIIRDGRQDVAHTETSIRWRSDRTKNTGRRDTKVRGCCESINWSEYWSAEPAVGRVAHGIPSRVDRLRCLGNAVVPQQAYPIFRAIAEVESCQPTP